MIMQQTIFELVLQQIQEQLLLAMYLVVILLAAPLLFVALDFWSGIRKAMIRGDTIRSNKMQRTVQKLSRYYNMTLSMLLLDIIQVAALVILHVFNDWTLYIFPAFTMLAVALVASIEIKSIFEPADQKESRELRDVSQLTKAIIAARVDPKELAEALASYMEKQKEE